MRFTALAGCAADPPPDRGGPMQTAEWLLTGALLAGAGWALLDAWLAALRALAG